MSGNNKQVKKYILAGAGTGGHLYPSISLGEKILEKRPESKIYFIGTKNGLEFKVIPESGYPLFLISVRGFSRTNILANIIVVLRLFVSLFQCFFILLKIKPAAVIGTGGYVSGPMLFMAVLLGYPTLIQEQNSVPGITTRWLAKWVKRVHLSFAESIQYFRKKDNLIVSGNPVRKFQLIKNKQEARKIFGLKPEKITLLIFGGSQGAKRINEVVELSLPALMWDTDAQIIWGTGKLSYKAAAQAALPYASRVYVTEYLNNMAMVYSATDIAVCRAGALTLAELAICGLPSILIPYPFAAAGHQVKNARAFQEIGAAEMILERELNEKILSEKIIHLIQNLEQQESMKTAALKTAFPNAADNIVESIFKIEKESKGKK
ncbi:undecaprenyldiphospho-muramoylpentapeptide beta-N-acetylglucosaminyltransferase [candidate division KSB1 bacterium]|nr:undecaprenyldiphospho-muramoylpentapeptide beta-N-acetylglucosaminyltransferase [candidate division KSB1 bacterium]